MTPHFWRRWRQRTTGALACAAVLGACHVQAQTTDWPTRPLRVVVGYASGSSPDVQARLLAEPLAQALGQPVVVENKPGVGGNIGAARDDQGPCAQCAPNLWAAA